MGRSRSPLSLSVIIMIGRKTGWRCWLFGWLRGFKKNRLLSVVLDFINLATTLRIDHLVLFSFLFVNYFLSEWVSERMGEVR